VQQEWLTGVTSATVDWTDKVGVELESVVVYIGIS